MKAVPRLFLCQLKLDGHCQKEVVDICALPQLNIKACCLCPRVILGTEANWNIAVHI